MRIKGTNELIAELYWNCPYSGRNDISRRYVRPGYLLGIDGFGICSGALGKGRISLLED
jgi:hypothetical protein